jgi:hypothetical protein
MNKQNKTYSYNIQLGAFILFGLAILLTAIFFVGQARQIFSQTFTITALFKDVNGLQAGNNVRFGGIHAISMDDIMEKLYVTTENANLITTDLATISESIRSGKGTIGKLFMDDGFANNLDKTLLNVKKGTQGFSENMEAAKKSIFLKGAFKKDKDK